MLGRRVSVKAGVPQSPPDRRLSADEDADYIDDEELSFQQQFPLLYAQTKTIDENIVRELFCVLKQGATIPLVPWPEWSDPPEPTQSYFNVSDQPPELIAGMLYTHEEYLLDQRPFVLTSTKDVRCRIDRDGGAASPDLFDVTWSGLNASVSDAGSNAGSASPALGDATWKSAQSNAFVDVIEGTRITYRLHEYESSTTELVVQIFQQVVADGPRGKFFTRAFFPSHSTLTQSMSKKQTVRNPVYGEERLRLRNPRLLRWCLDRDPFELGAAATIVKHTLQYYKYSFSVLRLVKRLMAAIRVVQRFTRIVVARIRLAKAKVIREWEAYEQKTLFRLQNTPPIPDDDVDAVVLQALQDHLVVETTEKIQHIRRYWKRKRKEFRIKLAEQAEAEIAATAMSNYNPAAQRFVAHLQPFSLSVDLGVVLRDQEQELLRKLTLGQYSVFSHPSISAMMDV